MIVIALLVGFVALLVFVIWFGVFKIESDQKKAEANADELLNEAFDGRDDVTYKIHLRSLKYETVLMGAKNRGYTLKHDSGGDGARTLIFEKV